MKLEKIVVFLLTLLLFLAACRQFSGLQATAPEAASTKEKEATLPAGQPWEIKWEKVVNDAKKEGRVIVYSHVTGDIFRGGVLRSIKQRYDINVDMIMGSASLLAARMLAEQRAGIYLVDVFIGGTSTGYNVLKPAGALIPLEPALILPELTDPEVIKRTWWGGKLPWKGKEHDILGFTLWATPILAINTELVSPGEINSYQDLLNPKWKGKIIMYDPTIAGSGSKAVGVLAKNMLGWDYFVKLARQEPLILRDRRQMVEWLARGKYAILWGSPSENVQEFILTGSPIKWEQPREGTYLTSGGANVMLIDRRPHPNAAIVFINWLLTKEASDIVVKARGTPSPRLDATREGVDSLMVPHPNAKYFPSDDEESVITEPEVYKKAAEIFGHLMR